MVAEKYRMETNEKETMNRIDNLNQYRSSIYSSSYNPDFYEFHHINEVPFDENGEFLDTVEVQKLKRINQKHHI